MTGTAILACVATREKVGCLENDDLENEDLRPRKQRPRKRKRRLRKQRPRKRRPRKRRPRGGGYHYEAIVQLKLFGRLQP